MGQNKIMEEIKNFLETNENELTTTKNLWNTAKAVLGGKFIAIQAYLKKIETFQTNNLALQGLAQPSPSPCCSSSPTRTGGTTTKTAQSKQKEGNNQDQSRVKSHRD